MLSSYFRVAFRNLLKNKVYLLINILGVGIALACCMTAYLLIAYNIEFDSYFPEEDVDHIVKVMHHYETSDGSEERALECPVVLAPIAAQEVAGIDAYTRFCNGNGTLQYHDNTFNENFRFADPSFFELFPFKAKAGALRGFKNPGSIVISEALAIKYFGNSNPIGETVTIQLNEKKYEVIVAAVLEKVPLNISFTIEALLPFSLYLSAYDITPDQWESRHETSVLFKVNDVRNRDQLSEEMNRYTKTINQHQSRFVSRSFELLPFNTRILNGTVSHSDLRLPIPMIALVIFGAIGLLILLIACFNLTNTTLSLTGKRLKEIGVRKVIGSRRVQIIYQFLLEMVITVSLALIAGVLMAQVIVPQFALMWHLSYGLEDLNKLNVVVMLISLLFVASTLAGIYPALVNSRFNPIELFRGRQRAAGSSTLSRILLVGQFSLSVIVLIAGAVFIQNASYQKDLSFGYDRDQLMSISAQGSSAFEALRNKVNTLPHVERTAGATHHIGPFSALYGIAKIDTTKFYTDVYIVGSNYFTTVGIPVLRERAFEDMIESDTAAAIVDENFVRLHRITDPIDAVVYYENKPYRIIGIAGNHISGLKQSDDKDHLYLMTREFNQLVVRAEPGRLKDVNESIRKEWASLFPDQPFEARLQNDVIFEEADAYNNNLREIFVFITFLGCLLSLSGIYALSGLNVQRRTKEIGVRKVLGASVASVIELINREFLYILAIATMAGSAGGYFITNLLLNSLYAQHVSIGWTTLIMCGFSVLITGLLVSGSTIFKAATTNPTSSLRAE